MTMREDIQATAPEDVTRLVTERLNAGDAAGVAALYEPQAVLAYPPDQPTTGREAIQVRRQPNGGWLRIIDRPEDPRAQEGTSRS